MIVFLVGEGPDDIGDLAKEPLYRMGNPGFLQPIIEAVVGPGVSFDGQKISLLGKKRVQGLRRALEEKAWRASLFASNADADCLVLVTDLDKEGKRGKSKRESEREIAAKREQIIQGFQASGGSFPCIPGIPCRTVEAWAMGDANATAAVCGFSGRIELPDGKGPEELWGAPRDPQSNHPKESCLS